MKKKFKCTKNLVLSNQVIIMKNDIIEIIGSCIVEDDSIDGGTAYYDINVLISDMCEGMELGISIFQLAEYFEYLSYRTKYTTCSNI